MIHTSAADTGDALRRLLGGPLDPGAAAEARSIVASNGAVGSAVEVARSYGAEADLELERVLASIDGGAADRRVGDTLRSLADHFIAGIATPAEPGLASWFRPGPFPRPSPGNWRHPGRGRAGRTARTGWR